MIQLDVVSESMADTLNVSMVGSARMAYAFEQAISNEGLQASSNAPSHEHGAPIDAIRYAFQITGDAALLRTGTRAAMQKLRERFPRVEFEIEGNQDDSGAE